MADPKLAKLNLKLWRPSGREVRPRSAKFRRAFPENERPAYTTVQTTVYRLETKKAVRRVKEGRKLSHL